MKVLIGITSKNRCSILPKAINSALRQSYMHKEVWVFDDASTDDTLLLKEKFPDVKWFFSKEPKGLVWARNFFMEQKGFDFFCSLDDDAWFISDDTIEKTLPFFKDNIGAIGFDMLSPDYPNSTTKSSELIEVNNYIGCGHIINLKAAKDIGYYIYNPGFYGGEEKDFSIRLINANYKVLKYQQMYIWHDKTNISRNLYKQHRSGVCNDLVFAYRRTPFMYLLPSLVIKILKHLRFALRLKALLSPCLKGLMDFFIWLTTKKTNRKPVSKMAFNHYIKLNG